ncbi:MAG: hypothetical protein V4760_12280 [Bdellovibrionota bacterium]
MIRNLMLGLVAVTSLCTTVTAQAQRYPAPPRPREVRLERGETIRAISARTGEDIRVTCDGRGGPGPGPGPGYPQPGPARAACVVKYNAPSACGLYTIFANNAPITGCIGSIDQVILKVQELDQAGICETNRIAPACELKYNAPSACGLYTVFAAGQAVTGCIGSTQEATKQMEKLRTAGACY